MKLFSVRMFSSSLAIALIALLVGASSAEAQMNLTVTVYPPGSGISIVDQVNGAVTLCSASPASCTKIGTVTPASTLPTAPVGISVYQGETQSPSTYTFYEEVPVSYIWTVNNSTGDVNLCNGSSKTCTDLGVVQ